MSSLRYSPKLYARASDCFLRDQRPSHLLSAIALALWLVASGLQAHPEIETQIASITKQLKAEPSRHALLLARASLYREHEQPDLALADYRTYAKAHPAEPVASLGIAQLLAATGRTAEAHAQFNAHLTQFPTDAAAHAALASLHADGKKWPAAITSCHKAIECCPKPVLSHYLSLIRYQEALGEADVRAPRATVEKALILFPAQSALLELQCALAEKAGDWPTALAAVDALMKPLRRKEIYLARKAALLEKAQRPADAATTYQQCLTAIAALPDFLRPQEHVQKLAAEATTALARLRSEK